MSENKETRVNKVVEELLKAISDYDGSGEYDGAFNIRADSECAGRKSTEHVRIEPKEGGKGLDIYIDPFTKGEKVYIPACISRSHVDDLVYNDFHVGEGADVTIVAGCGVHTDGEDDSRHNGIHNFMLEKNAKVLYQEKHIGTGDGEDSAVDLVSRSVAKDNSYQEYRSKINGNNRCTGHSECDAILVGNGKVNAAPELLAADLDASLIHEAAIGKVAGEQILKLRSLGLTEEEAERKIIEGFLRG